jgi:hypothetical protein
MILQAAWQEVLPFWSGCPLIVEPSPLHLTKDAGLLPLRVFDQHLGFTQRFAAVLDDPRHPNQCEHSVVDMVRARLYGILADYEDQNDHDTLRTDPVFKLLLDRTPDDPDLASQPTLSRFENSINIPSLKRLRDVFIDHFLDSFDQPPRRLVFDVDAVDDAAHGHQQLTCWHNYYDQNQYYPLVLTCANNDLVVMLSLRHGSAPASLGADSDLEYLVRRLRQRWPDVVIVIRGDAAFGNPDMYDVCERLQLLYTFGLTANPVLYGQTEALLAQAVTAWEQERQQAFQEERTARPSRLFTGFAYQAGTWPQPRWVVAKAEANAEGSQRRFVVTNRPGAAQYAEATYDDYAMRGESENRNKELKCGCAMDRLSDHRFLANYFRLYLHGAALNLLVRFRQAVQVPEPVATAPPAVPTEALAGAERARHFRLRRQRDVLGKGQPETWRRLLFQVAAVIVVTSRRVLVRLCDSWPHLELFQGVCERLRGYLASRPAAPT